MNYKDMATSLSALVVAAVLLVLMGSCTYSLVTDSRERKQQKIQACLSQGYAGAIELDKGEGWVCTGGSPTR